jgi:hypothetical protein
MIAAAADLHQVFGIIAVLAAIFFVAGDRATTARMSALFIVAFICHLSTFFPESSRIRLPRWGPIPVRLMLGRAGYRLQFMSRYLSAL